MIRSPPPAQAAFEHLGVTKTKNRNAVLIFVATASQTFAVIGDETVHRKCGDSFWEQMAGAMTEYLPHKGTDGNKLTNRVIEE